MTSAGLHNLDLAAEENVDDKLIRLTGNSDITVLAGGRVVVGGGPVHDKADVVIRGTRITSVGRSGDTPPGARIVDVSGLTVMPGLTDAHIHFLGNASNVPGTSHLSPTPNIKFVRAAFELYQTLASGVLTVRELGHGNPEHTYALRRARKEGLIRGPRIQTSGWALSQTRGHGDVDSLPYEWVEQHWPRAAFVDGEWDCRRIVRHNFGQGADVIKVYTSDNRSGRPDFTANELNAIVDEAHRRGVAVAAHAKTYDGVNNAVLAGIDTIEHGTSIVYPRLLDSMAERGTSLVPTLATPYRVVTEGSAWGSSAAVIERCKRELEGRQKLTAAAAAAGVRIVTGSDATFRRYGDLTTKELSLLVDSGLSAAAAIDASTSDAAIALRLAENVGRVAPGLVADLIAVSGDPLSDITCLGDRKNIRFIIQTDEDLTN